MATPVLLSLSVERGIEGHRGTAVLALAEACDKSEAVAVVPRQWVEDGLPERARWPGNAMDEVLSNPRHTSKRLRERAIDNALRRKRA